ncbi:MAG: hypothetical protein ABIQ27_00405 [Flavobacterium sp.]|uniref:hypothetical protein n=1 Tax=Flavobacterium sp. TaxID=239 RepID=UPI00326443A2
MKKILFLFSFFYVSLMFSQAKDNALIVLDSKKLGLMKDLTKEMEAINPDDISTLTVFKDTLITKQYGTEYGVIVITTKKYILETFYKDNIQNSPLKEKINSPEDFAKIGVITDKPDSKNQPYDELSKYIYTNTANEKIKKIASIFFINPEDAVKINPKWTLGAIEISAE